MHPAYWIQAASFCDTAARSPGVSARYGRTIRAHTGPGSSVRDGLRMARHSARVIAGVARPAPVGAAVLGCRLQRPASPDTWESAVPMDLVAHRSVMAHSAHRGHIVRQPDQCTRPRQRAPKDRPPWHTASSSRLDPGWNVCIRGHDRPLERRVGQLPAVANLCISRA